jgi:hypothetical protein
MVHDAVVIVEVNIEMGVERHVCFVEDVFNYVWRVL